MAKVSPVEGEGWVSNCVRCDEMSILVTVDGVVSRLTRKSVPYSDALVISKHRFLVFNVWPRKQRGLFARTWFANEGRPSQGRLYLVHDCSIRR